VYADFMQWWVEWQRRKGQTEKWLKDQMVNLGMPRDAIPKKLLY
jgi:hypothetical protein